MTQITLDSVYRARSYKNDSLDHEKTLGTFTVSGGTVNVYVSNADTQPTDTTVMVQANAAVAAGLHTVVGEVAWIAWESASGSPIVIERGVIN